MLVGCGVKACDLKSLRSLPKQINPGCPDNPFALVLDLALISTFARLLKNEGQIRNDTMDGGIRRIASGTR